MAAIAIAVSGGQQPARNSMARRVRKVLVSSIVPPRRREDAQNQRLAEATCQTTHITSIAWSQPAASPAIAARPVGIVAMAGVGSVSYTHLRAHETVLDIVCRLLLEKKKR